MAERPVTYAFYAVMFEDGFERGTHAVKGQQPEDAREISEAEFHAINDATCARTPVEAIAPVAGGVPASPDITALLDKIDALSKTVLSHAETLDKQEATIVAQAEQIQEQNALILQKDEEARKRVINAIQELTTEIGEKGA